MTGSELYCKISGVRYVAGLFRFLYPSKGLGNRKMSVTPIVVMLYLNLLPLRLAKKYIQEEVAYKCRIDKGVLSTLDSRLCHFCSHAYQAVRSEAPKYGVEIDTNIEAAIMARVDAEFRARDEARELEYRALVEVEKARCRAKAEAEEAKRRAETEAVKKTILNFNLMDEQVAKLLGYSVEAIYERRIQYLEARGIYAILMNKDISVEKVVQLTGLPLVYVTAYRATYMPFIRRDQSKPKLKLKRKTPEEVNSVISAGMIMHPVEKYCIASGIITIDSLCETLLQRSTEYDMRIVAYIINKRASGVSIIDIAKGSGVHPAYVNKILLGLKELDTSAYNYAIGDVAND